MAVKNRSHRTHRVKISSRGHFNRKVTLAVPRNSHSSQKTPQVDGAKVVLPGLAGKAAPSGHDGPAPASPPVQRERSGYDGDTAIKLYLREIGQVKLLTPEEEIELAARIKKGDKKAREQMIKANLRLVVKIAHD